MLKRSLALFARRAGLALAAFALIAIGPVRADEFSAAQKSEIESIVKSYLLKNPEILRETAAALEEREKQAETAARQQIIADPASPLFDVANQAVIGNPNGAITLVEFFDYNCGYCKRALGDLARLMKDNPDLRVVLRDLPILAPSSADAAKIANAATNQLKGDKFWQFHQKLLGSHGQVGKAEAIAAAKRLRRGCRQARQGFRAAGGQSRRRSVHGACEEPRDHGNAELCDRRRCRRRGRRLRRSAGQDRQHPQVRQGYLLITGESGRGSGGFPRALGRRGGTSNPQPPVLETGALTKLSYTPTQAASVA